LINLEGKTRKKVTEKYDNPPYDDPSRDDPKEFELEFTDGTSICIYSYEDNWGDSRVRMYLK
jgi:hypothetical protein